MSLFSILRKNGQETAADDGTYYSRAEEDSQGVRARKRKPASTARRDDAIDPVLPEKKRARRRLIGAIALVLAAVIGLPMILDSEPKPPAEDIAIQIPARDSLPPVASARQTVPAANPAPVVPEAKEEAAAAPQPAVAKPASPAAPTPVQPAPAKTAAPAVPPAAPAAAPVRNDDGARALALLEGRPDPRAAGKNAEKFVIQVAALASQEKVNELRDKLKRAGIASFTQKVATQSGAATRIRVGPFASREEAEKMRTRIVKLGLNGTLVPA